MSLLKKLAGETAIYGVSSILGRLINYIIMAPYLTRVFDKVEYGLIGKMYGAIAILLVFFTYRMETALFRFGKEKKDLNRTFSTISISIFCTTVFLTLILLLFSEFFSGLFDSPGYGHYFKYIALILGADAIAAIPFARLRLINRPMVFAAIKLANVALLVIFTVFFLTVLPYFVEGGWLPEWMYDSEDRVKYVFIANLIASLAVLLMVSPSYFNLKFTFDWSLLKIMLIYAAPLIVIQFAGVINNIIGIFFVSNFASTDTALNEALTGQYNAAIKIPILMTLFTQAFNYAAEPFFFRNADRSDSKEIYSQVAQAFTIVGALTFLGIMLFLNQIQLIIGKDLREGMGIVPLFLLAYLFLGIYYNFSIWYKLVDKTKIGGYIAVGGSIITLVLNVVLVPIVGIYGPGWAALACFLFMSGAAYWTGQKHYPIDYPIRKMGLYILASLSMYLFNDWLKELWESSLLITILLNFVIIIICLLLFYLVDRDFANNILKGVKGMIPGKNDQ